MAPVSREPTKNVWRLPVVMPSGWKPFGSAITSGRCALALALALMRDGRYGHRGA